MILKLIRGDYFRGLVCYVTRTGEYAGQDEARLIQMEGIFSLKTATAQLLQQASLAPKRTRRAIHILGRAERALTDDQYRDLASRCLNALGLEGRPNLAVVHDDDGHFHFVTVEQDEDGKAPPRRLYSTSLRRDVTPQEAMALPKGDVVSRSWDSHACWRLSKIARAVEIEFGLRRLRTGVTSGELEEAGERVKVPDWQLKREDESGLMPLAIEFGAEIKGALDLDTWSERRAMLELYGLGLRPYQGANAKRQGIQIYAAACPTHTCNGSDLGKNYGLGALNKRSDEPFSDWFRQWDELGWVQPRVVDPVPPAGADRDDRLRLKARYEDYQQEHRRRRAERRELNAETRRQRRRLRTAVKRKRKALLDQGLPKTRVRQICRVTRRGLESTIDRDHLERLSTLSAFPTRKLTWAEWLTERAVEEPVARRVFEAMRRRHTKEGRAEALAAAAAAKQERQASAAATAAEALQKKARAEAAATKLRSLLPPGEKDMAEPASVAGDRQAQAAPASPKVATSAAPALVRPVSTQAYSPPLAPQRPESSAPPARANVSTSPSITGAPLERASLEQGHGATGSRPTTTGPRSETAASGTRPPPDVEAVLREAGRARWSIYKIGNEYEFGAASVETLPGADELLRDPVRQPQVQARLSEMFVEQEKEVDIVVEALGRSPAVELDPHIAVVRKESVPLDIRPLLERRPWNSRIVAAAKARQAELSNATERPPAVVRAHSVETPAVSRTTAREANRPAQDMSEPGSRVLPAQVSEASRKHPAENASRPTVAIPAADVPAAQQVPAMANLTGKEKEDRSAAAEKPKPAAREAPHAPAAKPAPVLPKLLSEAAPDRTAYGAMCAEIEDFGHSVLFDPGTGRHKLEKPPREWVALLSSTQTAAETERRLREILGRRTEIARVADWIRAAAKAPGHLMLDGEGVKFPHFSDDQLALFRKHRDSEDISIELASAKASHSALEEDNRLAQLHAHQRGQLGRN
jgi:hypothetical protein